MFSDDCFDRNCEVVGQFHDRLQIGFSGEVGGGGGTVLKTKICCDWISPVRGKKLSDFDQVVPPPLTDWPSLSLLCLSCHNISHLARLAD